MDIGYLFLIIIFSIGVLGKSFVLVLASLILFILRAASLEHAINFIELKGIKIGLLFLLMAVLTPLAQGDIDFFKALNSYRSLPGVFALISGVLATKVNGMGLNILEQNPELIIGIVFGSIFGIIFLNGIPVGPLTAGGLIALFYKFYQIILS